MHYRQAWLSAPITTLGFTSGSLAPVMAGKQKVTARRNYRGQFAVVRSCPRAGVGQGVILVIEARCVDWP
jgi:hypothetical protein